MKENSYIHLDFMRGIAALLVMVGHLRSYLFVEFSDLDSPGIVEKAFYFVTGFGYISVMVFFVLSGFFITKSIVGMVERGSWSWRNYLIRRLSRLWTVLIPALVLTLFWDKLGIILTDSGYYTGEFFEGYARGPSTEDGGVDLSWGAFAGNAFFLGGIETALYGSNLPLWSLAYEFWYYILFPLAFIPFAVKGSTSYKLISLVLCAVLIWWLPSYLISLGLVWLFGSLVCKLHQKEACQEFFGKPIVVILTTGLFLASVIAARIHPGLITYLIVGLFTGTFVLSMTSVKIRCSFYESASTFFANMSYTLYLVHDSFLAFIACYFLLNKQSQFTPDAMIMFGGLMCVTIIYSFVVYWIFERNTPTIKNTFMKHVPKLDAARA